jgi:chromate transporter
MVNKLKEISLLFLKLGCIAFGGPAAHIAIFEREIINKRNWLSHEHFMDLIGLTNLIPGPNSTEMAIYIGKERAGYPGMLLAGICFILPAMLLTMVFAYLYKIYGYIPKFQSIIYGIKPAVISIIISAIYPLIRKKINSYSLGFLFAIVLVLALLGVNPILLMFGSGIAYAVLYFSIKGKNHKSIINLLFFGIIPNNTVVLVQPSNIFIFLTFLKIGAILYGGGYVLFAFLDAELVSRGIITKSLLFDSIAVGQFTPGPILSTATFIGWQLNGFWGGLLATIGVFLPSFIFIAVITPFLPKLRKSELFSVFLDAVTVASFAVIFYICIDMAKAIIFDWRSVVIMMLTLAILLKFRRINTAVIVILGAILGFALSFL